jgi:hypothetical protein
MFADILERFEAIEECYEFMLAYAAQGLPSDEGSKSGRQLRQFLTTAIEAMGGLADGCRTAMPEEDLERGGRLEAFLVALDRDAQDSLAAMNLVLGQRVIGSPLIDNLNASIHLRALLTDVFLLGEVLRTHRAVAKSAIS